MKLYVIKDRKSGRLLGSVHNSTHSAELERTKLVMAFAEYGIALAAAAPDKPVSAKSLINSFTKLTSNGLAGKPEEMAALLEGLEQAKADILKAIAAAKQEQIDADRVLELAVLQPTAKEKGADKKAS